jgi:hypothetical protein
MQTWPPRLPHLRCWQVVKVATPRVKQVPLASLHANKANPRKITDERLESLKRALTADPEMLHARPLIALPDGRVIAGNMRLRAATELGWKTIPTVTVDLDERRAQEWLLRDNQEYGEWDEPSLAMLLEDLAAGGADLDLTGFDDREVERLLDSLQASNGAEPAAPDPTPALRAKWGVEPGQLWQIGAHRLVCADATSIDAYTTLLGDEKAALTATDPPYNVGIDYGDHDDTKPADTYEAFSTAWMDAAASASNAQIVTPGWNNLAFWLATFQPYYTAVWIKTNSMTRGKVAQFACWEPICFHGATFKRKRPNDVFDYPVADQHANGIGSLTPMHPCPKPLAMWIDIVKSYTPRDALILDPFAGSGTAIIACEHAGRRCAAIDIEPRYVAVTLERLAGIGLEPRLAASAAA